MAERKALVRIAAKVDASVRKAMRGVTEDTQRVTQATEKAGRKRAQVSDRVARQAAKGLRETSSATQREALRQEAIARRVATTKIRESRRSAEAELRDLRRLTREQGGMARAARGGGRGLALGGAAIGGYHAAKGLVSEAQAAVGAGTIASRQEKAMDFFKMLTIKGLEAGLTKEELPKAQTQILAAAKASHQDPTEIMEALVEAQTRFAAFKDFIPLLNDMGRVATGTGTDIRSLVGMLGTAKTVFGLTTEEMREAMYFMVESAKNGSVSVEDLSSTMSKFFGEFESYSGTKGFAGFKEMAGTFQAVQKSLQAAPEEVGVRVRALMMKLTESDVQKKMARQGIVITQGKPGAKGATLLSTEEIGKRIAAAQAGGKWNAQIAQKVLNETRAISGATALVKTVTAAPDYFEKVTRASATKGRELSEVQFKTLTESAWGRAKGIGIDAQIKAIEKMEEVAKADIFLAETITKLQTEFPVLTKALGSLDTAIMGLAGGIMAGKLLGGGGTPSVEGSFGAAGNAAGKLGKALRGLGVAVGTFGASMAAANMILEELGITWEDRVKWGAEQAGETRGEKEARAEAEERKSRKEAEELGYTTPRERPVQLVKHDDLSTKQGTKQAIVEQRAALRSQYPHLFTNEPRKIEIEDRSIDRLASKIAREAFRESIRPDIAGRAGYHAPVVDSERREAGAGR